MGKASRIKLLGEDYDTPKEGPNALQLKKERQKHNKHVSDMISNKKFWEAKGLTVLPDGRLFKL